MVLSWAILPSASHASRDLLLAATFGELSEVKMLLANGADINYMNKGGRSALINASSNGHEEIVKTLLASGAKPDLLTSAGHSALTAASSKGYDEVVLLLLQSNADVNVAVDGDLTAIVYAAFLGYPKVVELLISHGRMSQPMIKSLQQMLKQSKYNPGSIDGILGPGTIDALRVKVQEASDFERPPIDCNKSMVITDQGLRGFVLECTGKPDRHYTKNGGRI